MTSRFILLTFVTAMLVAPAHGQTKAPKPSTTTTTTTTTDAQGRPRGSRARRRP